MTVNHVFSFLGGGVECASWTSKRQLSRKPVEMLGEGNLAKD